MGRWEKLLPEKPVLLPFLRKKVGDFLYPYGAFPDANYEQKEGYYSKYLTPGPEDPLGARYRTVIMVSAEKVAPLFLDLCVLLPESVHVVLERASEDIYTQRDIFVSDKLVEREQFIGVFKAYEFAFTEDGMLGFGAFGEENGVEVFLADHKEIVVFAPKQAAVWDLLSKHKVLPAHSEFYYEKPHAHVALTEYRGLRGSQFDYLHVADTVRRVFAMALQLDDEENVDEEGHPLGLVPWRAIVVFRKNGAVDSRGWRQFLQDFFLTASNRRVAQELLETFLCEKGCKLQNVEELFRIDVSSLPRPIGPRWIDLREARIWYAGDSRQMEILWN